MESILTREYQSESAISDRLDECLCLGVESGLLLRVGFRLDGSLFIFLIIFSRFCGTNTL